MKKQQKSFLYNTIDLELRNRKKLNPTCKFMHNTRVCVYCKANYNIKNPKTLLMIRIILKINQFHS